jgi:hypothetical protein
VLVVPKEAALRLNEVESSIDGSLSSVTTSRPCQPTVDKHLETTMPDAKRLAEAKMRIVESERALLCLGAGSTLSPNERILRARFIRQLREALEDYFSLLSGQQREAATKDT